MRKLFLFFLGLSINLYSQIQDIKSPQSSEFERYGNIPVTLSTGNSNFSIPIFDFNNFNTNGGKSFGINIGYNSSGFIPSKKSNYVGYNWFLNFGGIITRETKGVDDDYAASSGIQGFMKAFKYANISNENLYNGNYSGYLGNHSSINLNGYQTELIPDKFSFNFMGFSGYFYIDIEGNPVVVSNEPNIKIDINQLSFQYNNSCTPDNSEIIITDGYGNKYYFGGDYNNLEISYNQGVLNGSPALVGNVDRKRFSIKGWYLNKIIYYDQQSVVFNYKKYSDNNILNDLGNFCDQNINIIPYERNLSNFKESFYDLNKVISQDLSRRDYNFNTSINGSHVWGGGSEYSWVAPYYNINLVKKVFPDEIIINGQNKIKFNYLEYLSNEGGYKSYLLDEIKIFSDLNNLSSQVKKINFKYNRSKDYFFLQELKMNDQVYLFDYYNIANLPSSNTYGVDHWGYWNGNHETNNTLIPKYTFNSQTGDYKVIGESRNPNPELKDVALLKKVTYPTKGFTEFIYEPHTYSTKIDRNPSSSFLRTIVNENGIVGGARISKIINRTGNDIDITEYRYENNSGKSSGILKDMQRYLYFVNFKNIGGGRTKEVIESNNNYLSSTFSNSPIEYGRVLEFKNNQKYKEYIYSSYLDNPDSISVRYLDELRADVLPTNMNLNLYTNYNDYSNRRGNLLKEYSFDDKGKIIKKIENYYTNQHDLVLNKKGVSSASGYIWGTVFNKELMFPNLLSKRVTTDYVDSNNFIETIISYNYNNYDQISKQKTINSKEKEVVIEYTYPRDLMMDYFQRYISLMRFLTAENLVSEPVIIKQKVDDTYVSEIHNQYSELNGIVKKSAIFQKKGSGIDITKISDRVIKYDSYDNKGNLTQYTPENGIPVSIIWGYNGQYPVAKIEGMSLSQITPATIIALNTKTTDAELLAAITTLRTTHKDAMVTGYLYKPLIGVTKIVQPNGVSENYKYDSANRLEEIRNDKGELLKSFKYNYKQ